MSPLLLTRSRPRSYRHRDDLSPLAIWPSKAFADTVEATHAPTISSFYGIVIRMFVKDRPPPHFHALYGDHRARVAIGTGDVIDGELPPRATRLVRGWTSIHRAELEANWSRAEAMQPLEPIDPLP